MNKTQFIDAVAARLKADHKSTAALLDAILDEVYANVVKGEKVILTGFGAFERRDRAARIGRNPATGAKVRVKKTSVPAFRPGTEFKEIIAGRRKLAKAAPVKKAAAAAKAPAKAATKAATKAAAPAKAPAKTAATQGRRCCQGSGQDRREEGCRQGDRRQGHRRSQGAGEEGGRSGQGRTARKTTARKAPAKRG